MKQFDLEESVFGLLSASDRSPQSVLKTLNKYDIQGEYKEMTLNKLRNLREDRDLTQEQMAKVLHVAQRTYSRYESGERNPSIEVLMELSDYLDISIDYIAGATNDPNRHFLP